MKKNLIRRCVILFISSFVFFSVFGAGDTAFSWKGDTDKFKQDGTGWLHLSAERKAGTASLFASSQRSLNTSWTFSVKMNFKPSSNNNARIYLCGDTVAAGKLWGLCLRIGADRNIALWSEPPSGSGKSLLRGIENRLNVDTVVLHLKATMDWNGTFHLYSRLNDETGYTLEGSTAVKNIPSARFFGLYCTYSITRHKDAFSFGSFQLSDLSSQPAPEPVPDPDPDGVAPLDVVINELMCRPFAGGDEYVELYNRSDKPVDLSLLSVATRKDDGSLQRIKKLATSECWLREKQLVVVSGSKENVCGLYDCCGDALYVDLGVMTALPDAGGTFVVFNHHNGLVVDEFTYSAKMHVAGLSSARGLALERIDPEAATNQKSNWTSASAQKGYGSPGCPNTSYTGVDNAVSGETVYIVEPYRQPGVDCYRIHYTFYSDEVRGNILIFDMEGRIVEQAANNLLLGQTGTVDWHRPAYLSSGIYIVYMEAFDNRGFVRKYKFPVAVR